MSISPSGIAAGISVNGLPLTISNPGEIFWVNSTTVLPIRGAPGRADSGVAITGKGTYNRPFATINQALARCTALRGDIVMVMPGYTETNAATGSTGTTLDVAGVAIIGLGTGNLRPSITSTDTGSDINVTADDVLIYNFRFIAGVANQVHCLHVTGADFTVDNCEFISNDKDAIFHNCILSSNTSFGMTVTNNLFQMETTTTGVPNDDEAVSGVSIDGDNTTVKFNKFMGFFATAMVYNVTTTIQGLLVTDNFGINVDTTVAAGAISLEASATGLLMRNLFGVLDSTSIDDLVVGGVCGEVEIYLTNVEAETGGIGGTPSG